MTRALFIAFLAALLVWAQPKPKPSKPPKPGRPPASRGTCPTGPHPSTSLCWDWAQGGSDPADGFHIYRGTAAGAGTLLATVNGNTNTTYLDTTVAPGNTYYYTVKAFNTAGESVPSAEVTCVIPFLVPEGVTQLQGKVN